MLCPLWILPHVDHKRKHYLEDFKRTLNSRIREFGLNFHLFLSLLLLMFCNDAQIASFPLSSSFLCLSLYFPTLVIVPGFCVLLPCPDGPLEICQLHPEFLLGTVRLCASGDQQGTDSHFGVVAIRLTGHRQTVGGECTGSLCGTPVRK